MADTVIYTANYGSYDRTREQVQQDVDVDWLYITDGLTYPEQMSGHAEWRVVQIAPKHAHPNLAAKVYKTQPPWELGDWHTAIWIDANMQITDPGFVRQAVSYVNDGCAFWSHPRRDCVYDEAAVCLPGAAEAQNGRYRNLPIVEQMQSYRDEGFPEHWGLYASGTAVWTPEQSAKLGRAWLDECELWGFQDQLALPVVAWRLGVEPGVFGLHQIERRWSTPALTERRRAAGEPFFLANRWLRIWPHAREATP